MPSDPNPQQQPAEHAPAASGRAAAPGLIALNGALLVILALVAFVPVGHAGSAQPAGRAPGSYTAVAGELRFGNSSGIWIVDAVNQEMVALRWNENRNNFDGIGYRNLAVDMNNQGGRR